MKGGRMTENEDVEGKKVQKEERIYKSWWKEEDPITCFKCGGRGFITEYIYAIKMLLTRKKYSFLCHDLKNNSPGDVGGGGGPPAPVNADYQPSFGWAESNLIIMMSPGFLQRSLIYLKKWKREGGGGFQFISPWRRRSV